MKKLLPIPLALLSFALVRSMVAAPADSASSPIAIKSGQKLAFLGDSITNYGFQKPGGYVNLVLIGFNTDSLKVTPVPAGVGGNTSKDMLARIDKDVISKKPDWVIISCGVNDVWHAATGVELEPYKVNMTAMVDKCEAAGIKVMLLTATMIGEDQGNPQNQKLIAYNDFVRILAKEKGCLLADLNAREQEMLKISRGPLQRIGSLWTASI
jgi:lysophospholipase L1-like esterase